MKKDPLSIVISLLFNLNLLHENQKYNINHFKALSHLDLHWVTIKKYLKIISLIKKYSPNIEIFDDSKLDIVASKIYQSLTKKERFILYLRNNQALDLENGISIPRDFNTQEIVESVGFLFEKTQDNLYYLNSAGLEVFSSIKHDLSDLIFNEKEIDEVFFINDTQRSSRLLTLKEPIELIAIKEPSAYNIESKTMEYEKIERLEIIDTQIQYLKKRIKRLEKEKSLLSKDLENNITPQRSYRTIEIKLPQSRNLDKPTWRKYNLIPIPAIHRSFFPGYRIPFVLKTNIGDLKTWVAGGYANEMEGDPKAGTYISKNITKFYRAQPELEVGDILRITKLQEKLYSLEIIKSK